MNAASILLARFTHSLLKATLFSSWRIRSLYAPALFVLTALASALPESAMAVERTLEGSWVVCVTPAPESGIPPFVNLSSLTKDGRNINSDPVEGTALGEWIKSGPY